MLIRIPAKGKAEIQFWLRSFQIEDEVQKVMDLLNEDARRVKAFVPIISEYESGSIVWVYILALVIDSLGLIEGEGSIWLTNTKAHQAVALKARDDLAEFAIKMAREQDKLKEIIEMEPKKDV